MFKLIYKNFRWNLIIILVLFFLCISFGNISVAGRSREDLTGKELAQKVHDCNMGENSIAHVTMQLISKSGHVRMRRLTVITQDKDGIRNTFMRFTNPADIAGTGFLSLETRSGDTKQFLYLPALKRTRRIVSSQKGRSFVNTDFTYEDMERQPVEDFTHVIVGEEKIANLNCWILKSKPLPDTESEYSLLKNWIPKDIFLPIKTEYFDKKNKHFKTYTVQSLEKVQEIWTTTKVKMHKLQDRHTTIMETSRIKYNNDDLQDSFFTTRYLERW